MSVDVFQEPVSLRGQNYTVYYIVSGRDTGVFFSVPMSTMIDHITATLYYSMVRNTTVASVRVRCYKNNVFSRVLQVIIKWPDYV